MSRLTSVTFVCALASVALLGCRAEPKPAPPVVPPTSPEPPSTASAPPRLPLVQVADVDLPGAANRFDYQDVDPKAGRLVIAHMNAGSVLIADLATGSVLKELTGIPTARGVAVAPELGRAFITSSPNQVVIIDEQSMTEIARVTTGSAPDGIAWDGAHQRVGVSAQGAGALTLLADAGRGARVDVPLGRETGNVIYDAARGVFWITVVAAKPPDELVAVDPVSAKVTTTIRLPGCEGAHGLRLHPDGRSAFVACEGNDALARVALAASGEDANAIVVAATGAGPDVMALDPGLGWLYVAAESGDLVVFDIAKPGLTLVGHDRPGGASHSVAVDPATHRVFFPLVAGPRGTPILRVMRPTL